ncbi:MAG: tautomerase family protein [Acidobacteriota bacterium]
MTRLIARGNIEIENEIICEVRIPAISLDIGKVTDAQKTELIEKLSQSAAEITNIPLSAFIVVIQELDDDNIGVGGVPVAELKKSRNG